MTRKDVQTVLESGETVQQFTDKSLLKQAAQKKIADFLRNKHGKFVSFPFLHTRNYHSDTFKRVSM
jgi:hypothetical protein